MIYRSAGLVGLRFISLLVPNKSDDNNKLTAPVHNKIDNLDYEVAIQRSTSKILRSMLEIGAPGLTICVVKRGKILWRSAFGYCDVENVLPCHEMSAMRIASISKSIFAASMVAPLVQEDKLNLKTSIHDYLDDKEFPKQKFEDQYYDTTIEQLLSHTAGIRSYNETPATLRPIGSNGSLKIYQNQAQFDKVEFFSRKLYRDVIDALQIFRNDELAKKPGEYLYSSYGYTLLSAVIQKVLQKEPNSDKVQVEDAWIERLRKIWKMKDTHLDQDETLIPMRAKHYRRDGRQHRLINSPYVDNSCKWAGGGLISNTTDLIIFANRLFDIYHKRDSDINIERKTLDRFWTVVKNNYGLGFDVSKDEKTGELVVYHTGCSVGSSSILYMKPESEIAVAILVNIPDIGLREVSQYVSYEFRDRDGTNNSI